MGGSIYVEVLSPSDLINDLYGSSCSWASNRMKLWRLRFGKLILPPLGHNRWNLCLLAASAGKLKKIVKNWTVPHLELYSAGLKFSNRQRCVRFEWIEKVNMWIFHSFLWDRVICWQVQIKEKEWGIYSLCTYGAYRYLVVKNVGLKWDLMTKEFICVIQHKDTASASESTWAESCCNGTWNTWGNDQGKGPSIIALPLLDSFLIIYIWLLSKQVTGLDWPSAEPGTYVTRYHIQSFISVTYGVLFYSL